MKILGRFLQITSALWVLVYGVHLLALLLLFGRVWLPPWLHWFEELPLPRDPMDWRGVWPILVGVCVFSGGTWLVERTRRPENKPPKESES